MMLFEDYYEEYGDDDKDVENDDSNANRTRCYFKLKPFTQKSKILENIQSGPSNQFSPTMGKHAMCKKYVVQSVYLFL